MTSTILGPTTGTQTTRTSPPTTTLEPPRPTLSPGACAAVANTLAAAPQRWLRLVERPFDGEDRASDGRWFQRVLREERYEAWILGWAPGYELDFHDHGGSAGAFHVVRGALLERHTTRDSPAEPRDRVLLSGSTTAFGPGHVHSVTAAGTAPALSIHVYSPPLVTMTHYGVAPGSVPVPTSTEVC